MGLLNLFKRNQIADIVTIMAISEKYLQEVKEESQLPEILKNRDIESEMNRLRELNLIQTKNYQLLNEQYEELLKTEQGRQNALNNLKLISDLHALFPNSIIMGIKTFQELIDKYNLSIGLLENYTGTIPEKNIQEISKYHNIVRMQNIMSGSTGIYRVLEINRYDINDQKKIEDIINTKTNGLFIPDFMPRLTLNGRRMLYYNYKYNNLYRTQEEAKEEGFDYCSIYIKECYNDELFIACPKNDLQPQKLKFREQPVDPIVFNVCEEIVIIQSIWGEESEDKIIKDYIEYNKLFDKL